MIAYIFAGAVSALVHCGPGPRDIPCVNLATIPSTSCYMPTADMAQQSEMVAEFSRTCGRTMALTEGFAVSLSREGGKLVGMECRSAQSAGVGRATFCDEKPCHGITVLRGSVCKDTP